MIVKSDAMIQHEKWIEWVLLHSPKGNKDDIMKIKVENYVVAAAAISVVLLTAAAMMSPH